MIQSFNTKSIKMDKKRKTEEDKLIKSQRRFEEDKQRRFRKSLTFFRFPETKYEDALFATWNHDLKYGIHELWFSDWRPSAISRPLDKIEEQVLRNLFNEWSQSKNKQQVVKYFYDFERLFWDLSSDHFVRLVKEDGWLQSETIIFFMFLLETLAKKKGDENVIFFSSEFFDQLVRLFFLLMHSSFILFNSYQNYERSVSQKKSTITKE